MWLLSQQQSTFSNFNCDTISDMCLCHTVHPRMFNQMTSCGCLCRTRWRFWPRVLHLLFSEYWEYRGLSNSRSKNMNSLGEGILLYRKDWNGSLELADMSRVKSVAACHVKVKMMTNFICKKKTNNYGNSMEDNCW